MGLPTVALNETSPAGTAYIREGDDRIKEFKQQVREIMAIDHYYPSSGQNNACGRHKWMTLIEVSDIGTGADGVPILGAQLVGIIPELCYTDQDNTDVLITSKGKIALQNGRLPNNTYLIARNAADGANVDMLKVNASNIIELASFPITPTAAPDADYEVANKKYVDDQADAHVPALGAWVDKSASYAAQQAATDGYVMVVASETSSGTDYEIILYSDSNADPSTIRGHSKIREQGDYGNLQYCNLLTPVKKSDYWKVTRSSAPTTWAVYWIPLGS